MTVHGELTLPYQDAKKLVFQLKGFIFDVDGVFTDNRVPEGGDLKQKFRSYYDGQGVSLLRASGIRVCLVTNERDASARHIADVVERWNKLPSSRSQGNPSGWDHVQLFTGMGGERKVEAAEIWFRETGLGWDVCGVMGDDLVDVPMLLKSSFRATPASGEFAVQSIAHFVSRRPGGFGAVRDLANFILEAKGIDPFSLPPQ